MDEGGEISLNLPWKALLINGHGKRNGQISSTEFDATTATICEGLVSFLVTWFVT
jgi:hypothetical protein